MCWTTGVLVPCCCITNYPRLYLAHCLMVSVGKDPGHSLVGLSSSGVPHRLQSCCQAGLWSQSEESMGAGVTSKLTHVAVCVCVRHENEGRDSSLSGGQRLPSVSCHVNFSSLLSQCKCARGQKESVYGEDGSHSLLGLNDNTDIPSPLQILFFQVKSLGPAHAHGEGEGTTQGCEYPQVGGPWELCGMLPTTPRGLEEGNYHGPQNDGQDGSHLGTQMVS